MNDQKHYAICAFTKDPSNKALYGYGVLLQIDEKDYVNKMM
jgi:hypothetical protein